jgi:hypothetical protein
MNTIIRTQCLYNYNSKIYEKTYGEWTVEWWKWALSTPNPINPVLDLKGKFANINQPLSNVWFLAGKFGDEKRIYPHREVTIPRTNSILFPILTCEANSLEYPHLETYQALIEHVLKDMNTVVKKECYIDGEKIIPQRVRASPIIFPIDIPELNAVGVKGGGSTFATSDGYWIFLKSLTVGKHVIEFEGSCELGKLCSGASYQLTIF